LPLQNEDAAIVSVLNFGLPVSGMISTSRSDAEAVARHLRRMIPLFEPRLDPRTLRVAALTDTDQEFRESVLFEIGASTRHSPNGHVAFRLAVNFSNGAVNLLRRHKP
jgi:type VI secretion system protein ImpF